MYHQYSSTRKLKLSTQWTICTENCSYPALGSWKDRPRTESKEEVEISAIWVEHVRRGACVRDLLREYQTVRIGLRRRAQPQREKSSRIISRVVLLKPLWKKRLLLQTSTRHNYPGAVVPLKIFVTNVLAQRPRRPKQGCARPWRGRMDFLGTLKGEPFLLLLSKTVSISRLMTI